MQESREDRTKDYFSRKAFWGLVGLNILILLIPIACFGLDFYTQIPLSFFLFLAVFIVLHEFGHCIVAREEGLYEGWGLLPTPYVKMKGMFPKRRQYLAGIISSYFSLPLFITISHTSTLPLVPFTLIAFSAGFFDLIVFLLYEKFKKTKGWDWMKK